MYRVGDFYNEINRIAPFSMAESWDNSGLLIGSMDREVEKVLLALDATHHVVDEARQIGASLIITHHPVIFSAIKSMTAESIPYRAAAAGLSVISAHTNLDIAHGGVNDRLTELLGLNDIDSLDVTQRIPYRKIVVFVPQPHVDIVYSAMAKAGAGTLGNYSGCAFAMEGTGCFMPGKGSHTAIGGIEQLETVAEQRVEMILPSSKTQEIIQAMKAAHPYEEPAYDIFETHAITEILSIGRTGSLPSALQPRQLAQLVKERLAAPGVKLVSGRQDILRVAVCGGAGGYLVGHAAQAGAQALVTSELKHHELLEATALGLTVIDAGHFHTENIIMDPLRKQLSESFPSCDIQISNSCTDGVEFI